MDDKLNLLIERIVRDVINEASDLQPDNFVQNNALNKWRVLYNVITNLKNAMEITYMDNNRIITKIEGRILCAKNRFMMSMPNLNVSLMKVIARNARMLFHKQGKYAMHKFTKDYLFSFLFFQK